MTSKEIQNFPVSGDQAVLLREIAYQLAVANENRLTKREQVAAMLLASGNWSGDGAIPDADRLLAALGQTEVQE